MAYEGQRAVAIGSQRAVHRCLRQATFELLDRMRDNAEVAT